MRYRPGMNDAVTAVVLAAGAGTRLGGGKLLAQIGGRPVLQHVLDALATAGVGAATTSSVVTAITTVIGVDTLYNVVYVVFFPT